MGQAMSDVTTHYAEGLFNPKPMTNKTENHFSHYPRSQVDINSYTRLKIAMSLIAGKA
jgi:hypothetical protein